jgi:hypothetical protein
MTSGRLAEHSVGDDLASAAPGHTLVVYDGLGRPLSVTDASELCMQVVSTLTKIKIRRNIGSWRTYRGSGVSRLACFELCGILDEVDVSDEWKRDGSSRAGSDEHNRKDRSD